MADFWASLHAAAPEIRVLSRQFVHSSSPSPRHALFLSCLDSLWRETHYNRRLLFYEPQQIPFPAGSSEDAARPCSSAISQQLHQSLSDCLAHYYPWCGRLASGTDPPHRLFIDCNDAGVEFVEAAIEMPLCELAQDGFQMKPFFAQLCQTPDQKGDCLYSSPLLSVQVTFFSDGGLTVGVAQSHVVADGESLWNFMNSWGECSRGVPLTSPPLHDRERLGLQDPSMEKASLWKFQLTVKQEADTDDGEPAGQDAEKVEEDAAPRANGDVKENSGSQAGGEPDPLVQCCLQMSSAAVKKLKLEAGEGFSSYEVICAHWWRRVTAARQLPKNCPTYMSVLANGRRRLVPPVPAAYFGNVISFNALSSTAAKICSGSLQATASCVHDAVVEVQRNISNLMHYLEIHQGSLQDIIGAVGPGRGKGLNVASSPRFPVYAVDFGWGKPVAVRAAKVQGDGEMVLFGGRPGSVQGDVEICTALPASVLRHLVDDALFLPHLPQKPGKTGNQEGEEKLS